MAHDAAIEIAMKMVDQASEPMRQALGQIDRQTDTLNRQMGKLTAGVHSLWAAFGAYGGYRIAEGFLQTGILVDRLDRSMTTATGSIERAEEATRFLREESDRLGLVYLDQISGYQGLAAAGKSWNMTAEETQEIYLGVAEAATAMQLNQDDANGVFRAFTQIMSKGKLQAEEIRGQIGERLPGAFDIAAKSIGVTSAELSEMLERGEVLSRDFVPAFARQLREEFAGSVVDASQSAQSNLNRLQNTWVELQETVMGSGVMDVFNEQLVIVNDNLGTWIDNNEDLLAQKLPEYIDGISTGLGKIWDMVEQNADIIKYGVVGIAIGGIVKSPIARYGAMFAAAGHARTWVENLSAALALAAEGVISYTDIATANFQELEALVQKFDAEYAGGGDNGLEAFRAQLNDLYDDVVKGTEKASAGIAGIGKATEYTAQQIAKVDRELNSFFSDYDSAVDKLHSDQIAALDSFYALTDEQEMDRIDELWEERLERERAALKKSQGGHEEAAAEVMTIWGSLYNGLEKGMDEWVRSGQLSLDSFVGYFSASVRQMIADWVMGMAQMSMGVDGGSGYSADQLAQMGGNVGVASTMMGGSNASFTMAGMSLTNEIMNPGSYASSLGAMQNNIAWALSDAGFDSAAFGLDAMSTNAFGAWTAGIGTFVMGLLQGEDFDRAAAKGAGAGGGAYAGGTVGAEVGGPYGAAIGAIIGAVLGALGMDSILGDDLTRGYLAQDQGFEYLPGANEWITGDIHRWRNSRGDQYEPVMAALAEGVVTQLNDITSVFSDTLAGFGDEYVTQWMDTVENYQARYPLVGGGDRGPTPRDLGQVQARFFIGAEDAGEVEDDVRRLSGYVEENITGPLIQLGAGYLGDAMTGMVDEAREDGIFQYLTDNLYGQFGEAISRSIEQIRTADSAEMDRGMAQIDEIFDYLTGLTATIEQIDTYLERADMSEAGRKLQDINAQYDALAASLKPYGVDISATRLEEARQYDIDMLHNSVTGTWQAMVDQATMTERELALRDANAWYDDQLQIAEELGLSQGILNEAYQTQLDAVDEIARNNYLDELASSLDLVSSGADALTRQFDEVQGVIDRIGAKRISLEYGSLNVANPLDRLASAQDDYAELFAEAATGGASAVRSYLGFIDTYLQAEQAVYKSTRPYQDAYSGVLADLDKLGIDYRDSSSLLAGQISSLEETIGVLSARIEAIEQPVIEMQVNVDKGGGVDIKALNQAVQELIARGYIKVRSM